MFAIDMPTPMQVICNLETFSKFAFLSKLKKRLSVNLCGGLLKKNSARSKLLINRSITLL